MSITIGRQVPHSPVDSEPESPPGETASLGHRRWKTVAAGLAGLMILTLVLTAQNMGEWFWMDEGISVGIASHPISEIPGLLVRDGSPPLYYLLLHGWMKVFGSSEVQTHSLSLLLLLVTIPVGYWAGKSLFGRKTGWIVAAMVATSPFLSSFATETRMYTLVVLLSLVAVTSYIHLFVFGRGRYLAPFTISLALLLYTHNWGLFFLAGLLAGLVPCIWATAERKDMLRRAGIGFGVAGLAYLPWVPTLITQASETGAPWSARPALRQIVSVTADIFGDTHERVLVALVLTAGVALYTVMRRPRSPMRTALETLVVVTVITVGLGWAVSQVRPAWSSRYLAVVLPALLLVAGAGLAAAGRRGLVALALILVFWTQPVGRLTGVVEPPLRDAKGADHELAVAVAPVLREGDLVVAAQMEEVPVLRYYLGPDFVYADPTGVSDDPQVADWRDATRRMQEATAHTLDPALEELPVGGHVFLVCPTSPENPEREWFVVMQQRCQELTQRMSGAPDLRPLSVPALAELNEDGIRTLALYEKTSVPPRRAEAGGA